MFLAGDIGGTNTRVAFFEGNPSQLEPLFVEIFPSGAHAGLDEILRKFIASHPGAIESACFGIAGPILNGRVETPNLPWIIESRQLAATLGLESVQLINDLEANAHGIAVLQESDFITLHVGSPNPTGNRALISAGTGLGQAGLVYHPDGYEPFPSEGGHADFAPRSAVEIELLEYLFTKFEHVSYERVLSGPGILNIYQFLRDTGKGDEPQWLAQQIAAEGVPAISRTGVEGTAPIAVQTLDIFCSIYGAQAGNLALTLVATGGLFVGGGIAPRLVKKIPHSDFLKSFLGKGRVSTLLQSVPVRIITNDKTALLGAGHVAALIATKKRAQPA